MEVLTDTTHHLLLINYHHLISVTQIPSMPHNLEISWKHSKYPRNIMETFNFWVINELLLFTLAVISRENLRTYFNGIVLPGGGE
jgi:hypothetical protein